MQFLICKIIIEEDDLEHKSLQLDNMRKILYIGFWKESNFFTQDKPVPGMVHIDNQQLQTKLDIYSIQTIVCEK